MIGLEAAVIRWPPLCVPYRIFPSWCMSEERVRPSHAHPPAFRRPETLAAASRRSSRLGRADELRTDQEDDAQDRGRLRRSCRQRGYTLHVGLADSLMRLRAGRYTTNGRKLTHRRPTVGSPVWVFLPSLKPARIHIAIRYRVGAPTGNSASA